MKNRQKKVIFISPYFPPFMGGVSTYVYHIANGLYRKYSWDVSIVTSKHEQRQSGIEQSEFFKIFRLPVSFKLSNTPINPLWYFRLREIIALEKPDIINAHAPVPFISDLAALAAKKIPFILTYHSGSMIHKGDFFKDTLIDVYERHCLPLLLKKSQYIITSSAYIKRTICGNYGKKTFIITPGVDTEIFKPAEYKKRKKLLFVANLKKSEMYKGLDIALSAIRVLKQTDPDISLTIVGEGDALDYFKDIVRKLEIERQVVFAGGLQGKLLVKQYQNSSALIHPSLFDSLPTVLIEAMACGIPVIASKAGGIPEIVKQEKTGILLRENTPTCLVAAIRYLITNPAIAKAIRQKSSKMVCDEFTWEKKVEQTQRVFSLI